MLITSLQNSKTWTKLPEFIRTDPIFNTITKIIKPFPELGLSNCLEKCKTQFDDKPSYIGFTATGINGFWDLATMSMRGVNSCMHWDNKDNRNHLIGSVADPFLGIVYITDNTLTPYGVSFKRRALVRLVCLATDSKTIQYKLLIDRVYKDTGNKDPLIYNNRDPDEHHTWDIFKKFLSSKIKPNYPVILPRERTAKRSIFYGYGEFIPASSSVQHLSYYKRSLVDCETPYAPVSNPFIDKFAQQN